MMLPNINPFPIPTKIASLHTLLITFMLTIPTLKLILCFNSEDNYLLDQFHVMADQVVAENLILCFNSEDQIFMAHNIFTNKWLNVDSKLDFNNHVGNYSQLVHLGNDILCLAPSYRQTYPDVKNVLKFLRFSVKLVEEEEDCVRLTPLSFHPIAMDDDICWFADTFIAF
jgi:hypothetical protein